MAKNTYQWPNKRNQPRRSVAGVHGVDDVTALRAEVANLAKLVTISIQRGESSNASSVQEEDVVEKANYVNRQNNNRPTQLSNTYSLAWMTYENFSYANNKNVLNPHPGFNAQ